MRAGPVGARLHRLDRVVLVVHGRGGARHVVDLVALDEEGSRDVVADQLKVGLTDEVLDLRRAAGVA